MFLRKMYRRITTHIQTINEIIFKKEFGLVLGNVCPKDERKDYQVDLNHPVPFKVCPKDERKHYLVGLSH